MPVEPTPPLVLHLLGTPRVSTPDGPADLPLGKPLAALCYLALEPTGVERSDLARILWPDSTDSRARASIRQALWLIRKQTHPDMVREENGNLSLDPELIRTDLDELDRALAAGQLETAIELWEGGPLRGFSVPSAKHWQNWADSIRSRWEARMGHALEQRAASLAGEERVVWLERALEIRPYRVETWLALVHTHVDLRQADEAGAALARLRKVADESDLDLVAEAEGRLHLLRRSAFGDPDEQMVPEFVGRSEEFSRIMDAWRSACSGRSRIVGILGPSGIGKSSLASEVVRHVENDGAVVVEVRGLKSELGLEFGAIASMVSDLLKRPGAAGISPGSSQVLRGLVPSEGDEAGPSPQPTTLSDALADLLDAVSDEAPVMVFVDDAQWMDPPSAGVLLRAMRRLENAEVLAVWTCLRSAPGSHAEAVASLLDAEEAGLAEVLRLEALTVPEVHELVALLLTDADQHLLTALSARLHAASQGSPLHLVELLQGMRDRGHLHRDDEGNWSMAQGALEESVHLPHSLDDTLDQRVHDLHADAHTLGADLSRATRALAPRDLQRRSGWPDPRFDQALSTLFARGLVRWTRDDRVALAHDSLAARFERSRTPSEPGRSSTPIAALLAAVAFAVVALAMWRVGSTSAVAPHGGGTLWARSAAQFQALRWSERDARWTEQATISAQGPGFSAGGGQPWRRRTSEGWDTVALGQYHPISSEPPVAALAHNGRVETIFETLGDAGARSISPNGRAAIVAAQPPDTVRYRTRSLLIDLSGRTEPRVLAEGDRISYRVSTWSPDGRVLAGDIDAPWDTLLVIDPGGRRVATRPAPHPMLQHVTFCGNDRLVFGTRPPGQLAVSMLWNWTTDQIETVDLPDDVMGTAVCSPDGSAVAYLREDEATGQRSIVIQPIGARSSTVIPVDAEVEYVAWDPDPRAVPDAVRIVDAPRSLSIGDRVHASAIVVDTDGEAVERPVEWTTDNPAVASVVGNGMVVANRAGSTTLRAVADGWLSDSVVVQVAPGIPVDLLAFVDTFAVLDTLQWYLVGDPRPELTTDESGQLRLALTGDGRYRDGIISRESYDFPAGASLEATMRLSGFARPDRNRLTLCLQEGEPGEDPHTWAAWQFTQEACLVWPASVGVVDRDTTAIDLWVNRRFIGSIPTDTLLASNQWQRMGLQLRTDGTVSLVVGDSILAIHPIPVRNDSTTRWHATISGAAVGTELLLRDVTLWREERYGRIDDGDGGPSPGGSPREP